MFDVQKKTPLEYLGELRINLKDIRFGCDYQWLRLYSSESEKRFVTGSVYVKFELKRRGSKLKRGHHYNLSTTSLDGVTHSDVKTLWDSYLDSLNPFSESLADITVTDEQGFYKEDCGDAIEAYLSKSDIVDDEDEDLNEILGNQNNLYSLNNDTAFSDLHIDSGSDTDISEDSFSDDFQEPDFVASLPSPKAISSDAVHLQVPRSAPLAFRDNSHGSQTDFETTDNTSYNNSTHTASKKSRRRFKMPRHTRRANYKFSSGRDVLGVVFLEIISAEGLPPFKSATRRGFDMDPFVVVSFGRKIFRSSWRNHTLSPVFNERLAFEVLPFEKNYDLQFDVLDKDHFSFHDKVGTAKIPVLLLMDDEELDQSLLEDDPTLTRIDPESEVSKKRKKKLIGRNPERNLNKSITDSSKLRSFNLNLTMNNSVAKQVKQDDSYSPTLKIRARYQSYEELRREFWKSLLTKYDEQSMGRLDILQLEDFLNSIGSTLSDSVIYSFFTSLGKNPWAGDMLEVDEIIDSFDSLTSQAILNQGDESALAKAGHFFEVPVCPVCNKKRLSNKNEVDIITHVAICSSDDWSTVNKMLKPSFASSQMATKKWYSKVLIKLTYGKYGIGRNSANILVQDRNTGLIMEEKMSVYVRLGIKLFYKSFFDKAIDKKKMKKLLRNLSIKQGEKFDSPSSASQISSFIQFHRLDLSDCRVQDISSFKTFNQFFYRRLKPDARPLETDEPLILSSPCDSRCTVFESVSLAREIWIKGKEFSIAKLLNKSGEGCLLSDSQLNRYEEGSIGIFRLAPQDYHRFHSPCDGVIGKPIFIEGEYYTVNPMAIRSELDVFGENVRCVIPIKTEEFGTVMMIPVGAMMVGSILLSVSEGDEVKRGDEVGYFKFGGSTVILLFEQQVFRFDSDLVQNSKESIETLVRVGMSLGHSPKVQQFQRVYHDFDKQTEENKLKIIRTITGGPGISNLDADQIDGSLVKKMNEENPSESISLREFSWEAYNMTIDEEDEGLLKGLELDDVQLD